MKEMKHDVYYAQYMADGHGGVADNGWHALDSYTISYLSKLLK